MHVLPLCLSFPYVAQGHLYVYFSSSIVLVVVVVVVVVVICNMRNAQNILVGKPEGKGPRGRPRRRWENIRMGIRKMGWECVVWIHLAQDIDWWRTLMDTVIKLCVP
jgi:hypothetical protein